MYAVRSISPRRGFLTTSHMTKFLANQEIKNRIESGHKNVMVVDPNCKHWEKHPAVFTDKRGLCHCLRCDSCGMITHISPASLPDAPYASPELEEVPA
jgi:hypothetical protein